MEEIALRRELPESVLPFPDGFGNRSKYIVWKLIQPFHRVGRDILVGTGVIHHEGRQNFVIGYLLPGKSFDDFLNHLESIEFRNHFIALKDDGEVISVRRIVDFEHQYHLRVFSDGEVRGHFEFTSESHPRLHMNKVGQAPRRDEFLKFLEGWIEPVSEERSMELTRERTSVTRLIGCSPFGVRKDKIEQ